MRKLFARPSRIVHEVTSAEIILFEIGLDGLLIPLLKKIDDPLQREVFRRIDKDESRHLAMDHWLLDRKGQGIDKERENLTRRDFANMARLLTFAPAGFMSMAFSAPNVQIQMAKPENMDRYWDRVRRVTERSPGANRLGAYRQGVTMQRQMQKAMGWISQSPLVHRARA